LPQVFEAIRSRRAHRADQEDDCEKCGAHMEKQCLLGNTAMKNFLWLVRLHVLQRGPVEQLPIALDLETEWAVGVEHHPIFLHGYPGLRTCSISMPARYFYTVDREKQIAAHGFQSDDFSPAENTDAGGDRAGSRFSGLSRHDRWIPANI
jgi:hypothetical protein